MTDAAWFEVLENLLVDSVILFVRGDDLSDEKIVEYEQRGWEQRDNLWTCTVRRDE